jgi:hypothetical protein
VASVKPLVYSSMAAFLAHYRSLSQAASAPNAENAVSADERETLSSMRSLIEPLTAEEKRLLDAADSGVNHTSADERRRHRTELKLRRILTEKGILRG